MNEVAAAYARAVGALNRGAWQEAGALADRLLRARPDHAGVHFVAGVAALQLQQMPRALGHLQKAVELNPQRADYLAQFARALAAGHLVRQAAEVAARALVLEPTDPLTLDTLGVVFTQANAHAQAARAFGRAATPAAAFGVLRLDGARVAVFAGHVAAVERAALFGAAVGDGELRSATLDLATADGRRGYRRFLACGAVPHAADAAPAPRNAPAQAMRRLH